MSILDDFTRELEAIWSTPSDAPGAVVDWASLGFDPIGLDEQTREAIALLEPPGPRSWRATAHDYQLRVADAEQSTILLQAGRGTGKTHCASNVLAEWIEQEPGDYGIIAPTFGDAVAICVDGPSGFARAAGDLIDRFNRNEYTIYMTNGSRVRLASADAPDRVRGWNFTGVWCVAAGEPVGTARGRIPIQEVRPGDSVMTRQGWRVVTAAARTKRDAPTIRIVTDAGTLRCTDDHPVWVEGRGWVVAGRVAPGDTLLSWTDNSVWRDQPTPYRGQPHSTTGTDSVGTATARATTRIGRASFFTMPSGHRSKAPFPTGSRFIMSTTIEPITDTRICAYSKSLNIPVTTARREPTRGGTTNPPVRLLSAQRTYGRTEGRATSFATSAGLRISPRECAPASAPPTAPRVTVVQSVESDSTSDVYDLTVAGAHEFFAGSGSILVHNCDETGSWKDPTVWYEGLEFALRIGRARRMVTTTPRRGNKILKDLAKQIAEGDPDVLLVQAKTQDNAANLSASFLRKVMTRYEGTTLGRQELDGELLAEVEGALITTTLIDRTRVSAADIPELWRVTVAVDPAVTNKEGSDHTGIVVMGVGPAPKGWQPPAGRVVLAGTPHLYILQDASIKATPETWARLVLDLADEWGADVITAEKTQGFDLVETTVRLIASAEDRYVPGYHGVHGSVGKKARAEPMAGMWEQHRVHVMREAPGGTAQMEDEWTEWVPLESKKSPDRLDASVWGGIELMPELSPKGETVIRLLSAAG